MNVSSAEKILEALKLMQSKIRRLKQDLKSIPKTPIEEEVFNRHFKLISEAALTIWLAAEYEHKHAHKYEHEKEGDNGTDGNDQA